MTLKQNLSFPKEKIHISLYEGIDETARRQFESEGYSPIETSYAASPEELKEQISEAHVIGVRSKTKLTSEHIELSDKLLAIGCFTVGTDQVDLEAARNKGIPVFNAPYSSTRSVAELTLANIISLARSIPHTSKELHAGVWNKKSAGSHEILEKTLGIIGYGHVGQQVGLLSESVGMHVLYYDTKKQQPLGRAREMRSQEEVLRLSDFITLHVPATNNDNLISKQELAIMKQGSYLLNLSRGNVVDIHSLRNALDQNYIAGAALDVYLNEPLKSGDSFDCILKGYRNVILTPHIGGSTVQAQQGIGREVATSLTSFLDSGATTEAVNFPRISLPPFPNSSRILNVHKNVPGALNKISQVFSASGINIQSQYLGTQEEIGYIIIDLDNNPLGKVKKRIDDLDVSIKTRILY